MTLSDLILSETKTGLWSRDDWAKLGRGELTEQEEKDILADGYEAIVQ